MNTCHRLVWTFGLAGVLALCLPWPAGAQVDASSGAANTAQQPAVDTLSLEQLLSIEVQSVFGASKFLQKSTEAPAAVTVVTAEEIRRYGWRTLGDVLRSVRGFYVTDDRNWAYVGTRGFQRPGDYNTRLLLLVDGVRANDNVYDQAVIQEDFQLDLEDVDRIEIVRGPSSSLYGSNAFFGVINVVTKFPTQLVQPRATVEFGSLGLRTGRFNAGRELRNGLKVGFSATAVEQEGVDQLYFPEFDDPSSNAGVATGLDYTRRRNVFATVSRRGFSARGGFNSRTKGMPTGAYGTVFNDPRARVEDRHAYVHGGWEGALPGGWQSQFRAAYDTYEYVGRYPYDWDADPDTPVVNYMDVGSGDWVGGEALFSRPLGRRHHLTVGTEHRTNIRQLQEGYLDDPYELQWRDRRHSSTSAVFVQDEFRAHRKLLLNVGLRQDHYANFRDPLKPRVAAICQPGSRTTMKAVFGEAFRAPNVFESHYVTPGYYMANPSVRPEEIRTVEGVIEHYAGRRLRLSGSVFTYDVENLINFTLDPEDGLLYYDNIESAHAAGVELEAEAKWPAGVQARLSYAYTRARSDDTGDVLTNSPAHVTQGLFSTPLRAGAIVGVDVRALSSRRTVSGRVVGAHVVPNVTLSGAVGDQRLRYSFTVSNFTNTSYADPVGEDFLQPALVQNGRTARLRLTWAF